MYSVIFYLVPEQTLRMTYPYIVSVQQPQSADAASAIYMCVLLSQCCVVFCAAVHIVLVTDLVVLLTERDQKYNLPAILDLKVSYTSHTHNLWEKN